MRNDVGCRADGGPDLNRRKDFMATSQIETPPNLEALLDIPVRISVELGSAQISMEEVLQLGPGSVVQLEKAATAPVDLYVNQKLIARGEVVVMEEQFGIKITEIIGKQG
jgi:flagellar motor switch protein FliN/FliY